jgi:hypothetical protein
MAPKRMLVKACGKLSWVTIAGAAIALLDNNVAAIAIESNVFMIRSFFRLSCAGCIYSSEEQKR